MRDSPSDAQRPILKMRGISKSYPGVQAIQDVNLEVFKGEILGLVGENGAGKSTLMKVLAGATAPDIGQIYIEDRICKLDSPRKARDQGIAIIHQEMSLIPTLRVHLCQVHLSIQTGLIPTLRGHRLVACLRMT